MLSRSFLFVFAVRSFLVLADGEPLPESPSPMEVHEKCKQDFQLKEEDVAQLNKTRFLETQDENLKCFVKCYLTGLKVMTEEGDFSKEPKNRNPRFHKHFETCKTTNGTNTCDKAVNFQNCIWREIDAEEKKNKKPEE